MKAAQYVAYGGPEVIEVGEAAKPQPQAGQVLVAVRGAAINPFDYTLLSGAMKAHIPLNFPVTIGGDLAGVVESVGDEVTHLKPRDEVFGSALILGGGSGALAEYAVANEAKVYFKPSSLNYVQAAGLVLVGASAVDAIDKLELLPGQKLLIHGGAGGIGSIAVQYAKHLGLEVASTARGTDLDFVTQLGADETVDYETEDFTNKLKNLDGVFDTVGGETYRKSFEVLKSGGKLISMVQQPDSVLAEQYSVVVLHQNTNVNSVILKRLADLVEKQVIMPQIDRSFSLDAAADAFKYLKNGHPKGKVVISIP